jgi:hypothetical protein
MKLPILVLLFWASLSVMGQSGNPLEVFRTSVLPQYNPYFTSSTVSDKGQLVLYANEKYHQLALNTRKALMGNLLKKWSASLVLVQDGSRSELWGLNEETGGALRVDTWDINAPNLPPKATETPVKTALHPFFVYVGGQGMLDSEHNLNVAVNTRVGFFLLLNRWDLAFTFSGGIIGSIDSTAAMANQLSTGLMSRFYFPIQKLHISPNIGFDLEGTVYTTNEGVTSNSNSQHLLTGISWFVGRGSLDLGVRIGKEVTATVGYTLVPDFKKKKK